MLSIVRNYISKMPEWALTLLVCLFLFLVYSFISRKTYENFDEFIDNQETTQEVKDVSKIIAPVVAESITPTITENVIQAVVPSLVETITPAITEAVIASINATTTPFPETTPMTTFPETTPMTTFPTPLASGLYINLPYYDLYPEDDLYVSKY